jgi:sugar phosphate isomerase/epimerase
MAKLPAIGLGCANLLKTSLPEFIDVAARHGFRRITVRPFAFAEALRQGCAEAGLRRRLSDSGIEVTMIDALNNGLPGVPAPDALDASTRALMPPDVLQPPDEATCLRAASALGARMLNLVAYRGQVVPVEQMAEAVSGICRRAAPLGVQVALEFVPESGVPDLGRAQQVLDACDQPNRGLTLDVFHLARSGGTVEDVRRLPPGAVAAVQISDREPSEAAHVPFGGRLMPGEGRLPLLELVAAALENNPAATVDIEVLNAELAALPADDAAQRLAAAASAWGESFQRGARPRR